MREIKVFSQHEEITTAAGDPYLQLQLRDTLCVHRTKVYIQILQNRKGFFLFGLCFGLDFFPLPTVCRSRKRFSTAPPLQHWSGRNRSCLASIVIPKSQGGFVSYGRKGDWHGRDPAGQNEMFPKRSSSQTPLPLLPPLLKRHYEMTWGGGDSHNKYAPSSTLTITRSSSQNTTGRFRQTASRYRHMVLSFLGSQSWRILSLKPCHVPQPPAQAKTNRSLTLSVALYTVTLCRAA